jgi:N-acetylmuramoyl-L-alanine amidase
MSDMPYSYIVDHIPTSTAKNRRPGISMTPEYVTIHSTASPSSTARQERSWLTNPNNTVTASFHIVVDEKEAVECIPLNEVAWHAGDGRGPGNTKSIGVEICESGDREKTLQNAAELVAKLLHERKLGIDRVKQHFDWSGKNCPRILRDTGRWPEFLSMVRSELEKLQKPQHWAQKYYDFLRGKGIVIHETRFDDTVTRGELFALMARMMGYKE